MSKKTVSKKAAKRRVSKKPTGIKPGKKAQPPRVEGNVFRQGSSYATGYDILKAHPEGLPRKEFVQLLAKATGKSEKRAGVDAAVILSARDSATGPRHRSCREGYWIVKTNDHYQLRTA